MPSTAIFETPEAYITDDSDLATYQAFVAQSRTYILASRSPQEATARADTCAKRALTLGLPLVLAGRAVAAVKSALNEYHIRQGRIGQRRVSDEALVGGLIVGGAALVAAALYAIFA